VVKWPEPETTPDGRCAYAYWYGTDEGFANMGGYDQDEEE